MASMNGIIDKEPRMRYLLVPLLIVMACTAEFLIFATPHTHSPASFTYAASTCTVNSTLVNSCRPWLGGTANNYAGGGADLRQEILYQEERIGRPNDIAHTYYPVGSNKLTPNDVYLAKRARTILFVNWSPTDSWGAIGAQNAVIDTMATSVKQLGSTKIFMSLAAKPETAVSPGSDPSCPDVPYAGNSGSAAQYRALWAYVEKRFQADGVQNVVWAIDYTNDPAWQCLVTDLYPGDQYIDWVMFNAYENGGDSFHTTVGRMYNLLTKDSGGAHNFVTKPWGIAEWSVAQQPVSQEEAYLDQAKAALDEDAFPRLKAYMIYDSFDQGSATGINYRVGYDDNGVADAAKGAHYYAFADDPRFTDAFYAAASNSIPPVSNTPLPTIVHLVATPASIPVNVTSTLNWQATNVVVDGCALASSPLSAIDGSSSWTTPKLTVSQSYTLACKNSAGTVISSSVSVLVGSHRPPSAPPPPVISTPAGVDKAVVKATTGQSVANAQVESTVTIGALLTLDPVTVTDVATVKNIVEVQYYRDNVPLQRFDKPPFALQTARLKAGIYNLTASTYYADGSMAQESKSVTIKAYAASAFAHPNNDSPLWIGISCGVVLVAAYALFLRWRLGREGRLTDENGVPLITGQDATAPPRAVLPEASPRPHKRHKYPW